jgi:hypothetical protein
MSTTATPTRLHASLASAVPARLRPAQAQVRRHRSSNNLVSAAAQTSAEAI